MEATTLQLPVETAKFVSFHLEFLPGNEMKLFYCNFWWLLFFFCLLQSLTIVESGVLFMGEQLEKFYW